jgi:hypothetical protein
MRARRNGSARCRATPNTAAASVSAANNPTAAHFTHRCLRQNECRSSVKAASRLAYIVAENLHRKLGIEFSAADLAASVL